MDFYGPDWLITSSHLSDEKKRLARGESVAIKDKIFRVCISCKQAVQINKPVLGSTHFCIEPTEERT